MFDYGHLLIDLLSSSPKSWQLKPSIIQGHVPMQYPEVLLSVEVHHNSRKSNKVQYLCFQSIFLGLQSLMLFLLIEIKFVLKYLQVQEFLVLGRQMLTELRDKIYCITDHIMEKAGLYDPSGYFLIEVRFFFTSKTSHQWTKLLLIISLFGGKRCLCTWILIFYDRMSSAMILETPQP